MSTRFERISALTGILAVVLWIVGFVLAQGLAHQPASNATDAEVLTWIKANSNLVTAGSWIYMIGCGCFFWFAGTLRNRLAAAEGGTAPAATIGFVAAVATALVGMGLAAADMSAAIDSNDISAGAAGALHQVGTVFFLITEISMAAMLVGFSVAALRSRALPKWWAVVGIVLAVLLVIGPIGWLGVMFGMPLWTLLSTAVLLLRARREPASAAAVATA